MDNEYLKIRASLPIPYFYLYIVISIAIIGIEINRLSSSFLLKTPYYISYSFVMVDNLANNIISRILVSDIHIKT